MNEDPPPHEENNPGPKLPPVGKGVLVLHCGLAILAYLDAQGKWRNYNTGNLLHGEVKLLQTD